VAHDNTHDEHEDYLRCNGIVAVRDDDDDG